MLSRFLNRLPLGKPPAETYPLLGAIGFACSLGFCFGMKKLFFSPDVVIFSSQKKLNGYPPANKEK